MRGRVVSLVLLSAVCFALVGCMDVWSPKDAEEGLITVVVPPSGESTQRISPKVLPDAAEKVRIRVWHPDTGFNVVATVDRSGSPQTVDIAAPEGEGYTVAAVAYLIQDGRPLALTGGETPNVTVYAREATTVELILQHWDAEYITEDPIEPEAAFSVEIIVSDAGGLITLETLEAAQLHASTTAFQDPATALPANPVSGIVSDGRITFAMTAPDVEEETTLYLAALAQFTPAWDDRSLVDPSEYSLFLELPNRQMDQPIHEVTIDPLTGGIIVEITRHEGTNPIFLGRPSCDR